MPTPTKKGNTPANPASKRSARAAAAIKPDGFVGKRAPSFSASATQIGKISSGALKGKAFILYFYPKDDTSGCTAEACDFRDALPHFTKLGIPVFGVSKDNLDSHEKFTKKNNISFPLIADVSGDICEKFGTWKEKSMYGRHYMGIERSTFLIDGKGIIRAVWRKVSVPGHTEEVRKAAEEI